MKIKHSLIFIIMFVGCSLLKAVISNFLLYLVICAALSAYSLLLIHVLDVVETQTKKKETEDLFNE